MQIRPTGRCQAVRIQGQNGVIPLALEKRGLTQNSQAIKTTSVYRTPERS